MAPQTDIITEHHPLVPKSAYGQSKLNIEIICASTRAHHLDIKILRLHPFGPRQTPTGYRG
jgi:UDP-glucose 4-epimerase